MRLDSLPLFRKQMTVADFETLMSLTPEQKREGFRDADIDFLLSQDFAAKADDERVRALFFRHTKKRFLRFSEGGTAVNLLN